MKESQATKNCKGKKRFFSILHCILLFGPLLFFFPYGFIMGTVVSKVSMGLSVIVSIILAIININMGISPKLATLSKTYCVPNAFVEFVIILPM